MYKLIFIFFLFVSSPLYSNEFTYHCDRDSDDFSMVFDVNRFEKTVVHTHSIFKESNNVIDVNKSREIYYWDEENNSVWFLNYTDGITKLIESIDSSDTPPSLSITLLNFERKKLFYQSLKNVTPKSWEFYKNYSPFSNSTYDCYILE